MLLTVLLLPLNLLSRNRNTGRKIALGQHRFTEFFSLEQVSTKQLASLIYAVVTKSFLRLMEFPSSGYCDKGKPREQGWVIPLEV